MQEQDTITYQCIHTACGQLLPRVVRFCPYCGTPQQAGVTRPASIAAVTPVPPERAPEPAPLIVSPTPPLATSPRPVPRAAAAPATAPQRASLHWGWWLLGLGVLWLAWIVARPASHKLDSRIDAAIGMAQACKGKQAQSELIALRGAHATPVQLQRLQTALNDASSTCERTRLRAKAWFDASAAIDAALASAAPERARARLATFTRRWGEDAQTAAAKARIDAAKRDQAAPAQAARESGQASASNLITEAERDISRGNYKGAIDKMDACVAMVDAGKRDCRALRAKAERLYQGL